MRIAYWYFHLIYLPWIKESIISLLTFSLTRLSTQRIPSFWLEFSIILYIICQTLILVGAKTTFTFENSSKRKKIGTVTCLKPGNFHEVKKILRASLIFSTLGVVSSKEEIWPFLRRFSVNSKVLVIGDFQGYH